MNLSEDLHNENFWQDSFWVFRNTVLPCLTLNQPIEKLMNPDEVFVSVTF